MKQQQRSTRPTLRPGVAEHAIVTDRTDPSTVVVQRRRRTRAQERRENRASKVEVVNRQVAPVTIACPPWLVSAAGGGLSALFAAQCLYWFQRSSTLRPDGWPETWFTSWYYIAKQLHVPAGRAEHKRLRRSMERLVVRELIETRQCPPIDALMPQEMMYEPPLIEMLARIPASRRLAVCRGDAMKRPGGVRVNVNAVHPGAASRFGENEAIVLAWLTFITRKGKPMAQSRESLSRMTGLSIKQSMERSSVVGQAKRHQSDSAQIGDRCDQCIRGPPRHSRGVSSPNSQTRSEEDSVRRSIHPSAPMYPFWSARGARFGAPDVPDLERVTN